MDSLLKDAQLAARRLLRARGFALAVAGTLTIAIGANTVVFSVVNGVLLRPLPFRAPGQLVYVVNPVTSVRKGDGVSPLDFADWRREIQGFDGLAAYLSSSASLTGEFSPVRLSTAQVSANWFTLLGVPAALGRVFVSGDDQVGAKRVVVLSDAAWRARFGGDPHVIDHQLLLDDTTYTIIGVASPRLTLPVSPDLWVPFIYSPQQYANPSNRGGRPLRAIGRLHDGVSLEQAKRSLQVVTARLRADYPEPEAGLQFDLVPLQEKLVGDARPALLVLLGAVGCVLMIACANVANLFLVRSAGRTAEIGIRTALGASRGRIVRQLMVESLLLAVLGGAGGLLIATWAVHALAGAHVGNLPRLDGVSIDATVLSFMLVVTIATGVLFGLAPALQATNPNIAHGLAAGARGSSARKATGRLRATLVIAEMALVAPLLIGATLLGKSLAQLSAVDPGFRPTHVVRFDAAIPVVINSNGSFTPADSARLSAFTADITRRLAVLPGTQAVSAARGAPFTAWVRRTLVHVMGQAPEPRDRPNPVEIIDAAPNYFATLGIPLIRGRVFTADDRVHGHPVAIINQALATQLFQGDDPIGKTLAFATVDSVGQIIYPPIGEIVGIVGDTKSRDLSTPALPAVYDVFDQDPQPVVTVIMRSTNAPESVIRAARRELAAVNKNIPMFNATSYEDAVRSSADRPRLDAWLVAAFATVALGLGIIGIYGVISYTVRERHRELGIRIALGARATDIVGMVVRQGLRLAMIGLGVGAIIAMLGGIVLRGLLYHVAPVDPFSYVAVFGTLVALSAIASWIPAQRASSVDPVIAMRPE